MITIAILVTLSVLFVALSVIDRCTDRFFLHRLATLGGAICAAATVLFDAFANY